MSPPPLDYEFTWCPTPHFSSPLLIIITMLAHTGVSPTCSVDHLQRLPQGHMLTVPMKKTDQLKNISVV